MRNPFGIARRLSFATKNSQRAINRALGACSGELEDSTKLVRSLQSRGFSEKVAKALEAISKSRGAKSTKGKTLYLIDENAAKEFSAIIMADHPTHASYVAEINSGLGFLSEDLLRAGIPSINMFERVSYLIPNLVAIADKYSGRAVLRPTDFQHLWAVGYVDWKENSNRLKTYFGDIEKRKWNDVPAVQLIGALGDMNFIRRLTSTVIFQNALAKFGRMVLYAAVPPSVWAHLTCTNESYYLYRNHIVLFQILFNYELLGTLPRSAFYPHHRKSNSKKYRKLKCYAKITQNDGRLMNVVKIEPKPDFFENNLTQADIVPFYYFVHHHLKSRANRVIPALEKWVPGCGRILIAHGFTIYTEFGELTPQEIVDLFKLFRSWPEFKQSSFVSCMDTFLLRMDEHGASDPNADNLEEMFEFSLDETQTSMD